MSAAPMMRPSHSTERRTDHRAPTVFTIGRLVHDRIERPCMVRDVSEGGMRIQLAAPPAPGSRVTIEMRGLPACTATVRWVDGQNAGLAFAKRHDIAPLLDPHPAPGARRARTPRFALDDPVTLLLKGRCLPARLADISVGGARLAVPEPLRCGTELVLGPGLALPAPWLLAHVCWSQGDACGIRFARSISSLLLARALDLRREARRP